MATAARLLGLASACGATLVHTPWPPSLTPSTPHPLLRPPLFRLPGNELDLALDVYRQMLAEGCTPNLVTYNTLIDVYGKTGAWEEAIRWVLKGRRGWLGGGRLAGCNCSCATGLPGAFCMVRVRRGGIVLPLISSWPPACLRAAGCWMLWSSRALTLRSAHTTRVGVAAS